MNIVTDPDTTGFAPRESLWRAYDIATYDYDMPIGWGATREQAIEDLRQKIADAEEAP